jgi:hypothetical protein
MSIGNEAPQHIKVLRIRKVKCDIALVSIHESPPNAFTVARISPSHATQTVANLWSFYFDDIGAKVGQVTSAVWPCQHS